MLALVTTQLGWLLAVPVFNGTDEVDHVYRAASVARGHATSGTVPPADGRGYLIPVPSDIVDAARESCSELAYVGPDNCRATTQPDERGQVLVASAAATYNPVWYWVVGSAALPFDGGRAALAMRLCSLLMCDLVVAAALVLLLRRTGSRWAVLGIALACTPTLVYSTVNAAPNGLGYCAGLLLWASVLSLPRQPTESARLPLAGVAAGGVLILVTHSTGLVWVVMSLLCAIPVSIGPLRQLWGAHRRAVAAVALALVGAAAASSAWVVAAGTNDPRSGDGGGYGPVPLKVLVQGLILWPLQSIATLRLRNDDAPIAAYAIGAALLLTFVLAAVRSARRAERLSMAMVAAASILIPLLATAVAYPSVAAAWQGRYGLALSLGLVVLAATVLARTRGPGGLTCWVAALAWTVVHWTTLAAMFGEELAGVHRSWTPWVVGAGAAATAVAYGLALSGARGVRASKRQSDR
jgi:hypothetical protein